MGGSELLSIAIRNVNRFNDTLQIGMEAGVIEDMLSRGSRIDDLPQPESLETQDDAADRAAIPH